ncbi:MAG: DUF4097 family beta strand repeat protein [Ignavibacteriales bacterium]|nr:DUF4097 family beta strand repeat protein [Ignavibacteriales bacterium]
MKQKILTIFFLSLLSVDKINVQLADPTRPVTLKVNLLSGSIVVQGYSGKEVIVETSPAKLKHHNESDEDHDEDDEEEKSRPLKQGLRLIPNLASGLSVEEDDNEVTVSTSWRGHNNPMEIKVQVPFNCSMKLSTVNNGDIEVSDVTGDVEVNNVNGSVTLNRINGSAVAHALNHELKVSFVKVNPQRSMSFSSLNGDVDVTFPADIKATFNMKSEQGEIYSDFDLDLEKTTSKVEEKGKSRGRYKVTVERALKGKVNGGGQEILFKNFNGNIYIRKGK